MTNRTEVSRQAPGKTPASPRQAPRFSGKPQKNIHFYLEKTEVQPASPGTKYSLYNIKRRGSAEMVRYLRRKRKGCASEAYFCLF